jgi:hypothetical protein
VGFTQGLHPRSLQGTASRVCVELQLSELWLDELRPLHGLVRHGLSKSKLDDFVDSCAHTLLLLSQEHLGARLSMRVDRILLQNV